MTTKAVRFLRNRVNLGRCTIVKRHCTALILTLISGDEIAATTSAQRNPVLDQEKAIAANVEGRAHIRNFDL